MEGILQRIASLPLTLKLASAVFGILVIHAAFRLLERTLPRHFGRADARYHVRKFVVFFGYFVAILFLVVLFDFEDNCTGDRKVGERRLLQWPDCPHSERRRPQRASF